MMTTQVPLAEITTSAIRILCREIGAANTARFLGQFTNGYGNYTEDRDEILGEPTVDELVAAIHQRRATEKRPRKSRSRRTPRSRNR